MTTKEKMRIEVVRLAGEWVVEFGFGVQTFTLRYGGTKAEALWMAKMLRQCFANYTETLLSPPTTSA